MFTHFKRLTWKASLMTTLINLVAVTVALAASGDLDTTFDGDGKVTTNVVPTDPNRKDEIWGLAIQSNGKIVAAGSSYLSGTETVDFALTRYNTNGSLDTTFSGDGRLITSFGGRDWAYSVAIQPDGKIVVAGDICTGGSSTCDVALARYNPSGALDTTFNGTGKVVTDFGADYNTARKVVIQSDGKIVLVGWMYNGSDGDIAAYRYNPNGTLDTTFSGDGMVSFDFGPGQYDQAYDMNINSDGKIIVAGSSDIPTVSIDFALARLNPDGTLDTTFSGDGKQTTGFGASDFAYGIASQADGKMIVVGGTIIETISDIAVARYNTDGSLDTTFDGDGKKVIDFISGRDSLAWDVIVHSNGKIVLAGETDTPANNKDFFLVRLNPNGTFDKSFSGDGKITIDFGGNDIANALAVQSDSKYVLGGYTTTGGVDFVLARVLSASGPGDLDATFSGDGQLTTSLSSSLDDVEGLAIQADGKIVAAGTSNGNFALTRYNPNGALDATFDVDGKLTTDFGGTDIAYGVTVQPDGKIVVGGVKCVGAVCDLALARYNPNGALDTTFSGDGKVVNNSGGGHNGANSLALQPDGKIVMAGFRHNGTDSDLAVYRYNADGKVDNNFSGDGISVNPGAGNAYGWDLAIQSDGKIVVVGESSNNFLVARLNSNGNGDSTFSGDGLQITNLGADDLAYGLALQPDGKVVVVGEKCATTCSVAMARYTTNGNLDTTFDGDGKKVFNFAPGPLSSARSVIITSNGRIAVAGAASGNFGLVRLLPSGAFDTSFSVDGKVLINFGGDDEANVIARQPLGGRYVLGGFTSLGGDFALARVLP